MYWHLTLASEDRLALFPSPATRLQVIRVLVRLAAGRTLLFCVADDHLHLVLVGDRPIVGRHAQRIGVAMSRLAAARLAPARIREVATRSHLRSLVAYVLDQSTHHRLSAHAALWPGTCFHDLVGARVIGFTDTALREALPRLATSDLFAAVSLPPIAPAADPVIAALGLVELTAAAAAAVAVDRLEGRTPEVVAAKRVVAHLALHQGVSRPRLADQLGLSTSSAARHARVPVDPTIERAVRLRIAIDLAARSPAVGETHRRTEHSHRVHNPPE